MSSATASALRLVDDKQRWLQLALPAAEYEQVRQLPLHVALSLYPHISLHGPNANVLIELVNQLTNMGLEEILTKRKAETKQILQRLWTAQMAPQEMPEDYEGRSFGSWLMSLVPDGIEDLTYDFLYEVLMWVAVDALIDPDVIPDSLVRKKRRTVYEWMPRLMELASMDATKYLKYSHLYGSN